jgi:predicted membrane-bound mannosyltransferase
VQAALCAVVLGAAAFGARQAWQGNFVYAADARNPYAYAHTSSAVTRLVDQVHALSALDPAGKALPVYVIQPGGDYWPLPWYFRDLTRVGYWSDIPAAPDAPVIVTDPRLAAQLQPLLKDKYFTATHGLRPGRLLTLFVRQDLWDRYMAGRS